MKYTSIILSATAVCVLATLLSSGGFAQPAEQPAVREPFMPEWSQRPTGRDFARYYPERPVGQGLSGAAVLCCVPRDDGSLSCIVGAEAPENNGFGDAAVQIAHSFRMAPDSIAAYRADPLNYLQVPITFIMNTTSRDPDIRRFTSQFRAATEGVCSPVNATFSPDLSSNQLRNREASE